MRRSIALAESPAAPHPGQRQAKQAQAPRSTLELFRHLRHACITIFHPEDENREVLTQQLHRIGCQTVALWPPVAELPAQTELVIFLLDAQASAKKKLPWLTPESAIPLIGVLDYENPTTLETATGLGCHGMLVRPLQAKGLLSTLIMTMHHCQQLKTLRKRTQRLEEKLQAAGEISAAQAMLAHARGISAVEAYKILREQAMLKRVTVEEIARSLLRTDGLLSNPTKSR